MNIEGIIHRCAYTDCYARNENELVINIRTNKDITAVNLIYEDPYINGASGRRPWCGKRASMNVSMELKKLPDMDFGCFTGIQKITILF